MKNLSKSAPPDEADAKPVRRSKISAVRTRDQLLDAAEALFAERGFYGVSVREIAARAKANLGAIPYYFGTKENLLKEVLQRRAAPELRDRNAAVKQVLEAAGDRVPDVQAILEADFAPVFRSRRGNIAYRRLAGRLSTDPAPEVRRVVEDIYNRESVIFDLALKKACPHLSHEEFYWRYSCLFGAVQYVLADIGKVKSLAGRDFDTSDPQVATKYIVRFLSAGLLAPAVTSEASPAAPGRRASLREPRKKAISRS